MEDLPSGDNKELREMTLVGHLGELRRRIIISVLAIVVGTIVAYAYVDELMKFVTAPAGKLYFMSPAE
ncbi:MAG TPA: twin-arginine translocase subunit TatC, partial [Negativicutes bacterium]|nr:twin-arginine translocase subunit TatC [Negativicutes bacterium]